MLSQTLKQQLFKKSTSFLSSIQIPLPVPNQKLINFDDATPVQQLKTKHEIRRALFVLKMCSLPWLVQNSLQLMTIAQTIIGKALFSKFMKMTFYGQFVGGENEQELAQVLKNMESAFLLPMIAFPMEEPVQDISNKERLELYRKNSETIVNGIAMIDKITNSSKKAKIQIKITSLVSTNTLINLSKMWLAQCPEENVPDKLVQDLVNLINGNETLLSEDKDLVNDLKQCFYHLKEILNAASSKNISVLIDAEYTKINPALSLCFLALGLVYNKSEAVVWNTYQQYLRKGQLLYESQSKYLLERNVCFGAKIVRGAYLDWENTIGKQYNQNQSAVWESHDATNKCYDKTVSCLIEDIKVFPGRVKGVLATHNTASVSAAITQLPENRKHGLVFGQLYGMGDNISCPLAAHGYQVYKSVPYGTIEETIPYLVRRAKENNMVFGGIRQERTILKKALNNKI